MYCTCTTMWLLNYFQLFMLGIVCQVDPLKDSKLSYTSEAIYLLQYLPQYLLRYLEQNGINIQNCRGQSYDDASNMSGMYIGMQAQLKRVNPLIDWVQCAPHSPNLVFKSAVDACVDAVSIFGVVQKLFSFCINIEVDHVA